MLIGVIYTVEFITQSRTAWHAPISGCMRTEESQNCSCTLLRSRKAGLNRANAFFGGRGGTARRKCRYQPVSALHPKGTPHIHSTTHGKSPLESRLQL
jgi:hypothetical protein